MKYSNILTNFCAYNINVWCFQEIFSSKYTPRNFVTNSLLIRTLFMWSRGKIFGISFLSLEEWNEEYFVFEIFRQSLLALNEVANFCTSSFIVSKRFYLVEWEINKFASSANIIGVSFLDLLKMSFIYLRNNIAPRMEPCGTPRVI